MSESVAGFSAAQYGAACVWAGSVARAGWRRTPTGPRYRFDRPARAVAPVAKLPRPGVAKRLPAPALAGAPERIWRKPVAAAAGGLRPVPPRLEQPRPMRRLDLARAVLTALRVARAPKVRTMPAVSRIWLSGARDMAVSMRAMPVRLAGHDPVAPRRGSAAVAEAVRIFTVAAGWALPPPGRATGARMAAPVRFAPPARQLRDARRSYAPRAQAGAGAPPGDPMATAPWLPVALPGPDPAAIARLVQDELAEAAMRPPSGYSGLDERMTPIFAGMTGAG